MYRLFYNELDISDVKKAKILANESTVSFLRFIDSSPICITITTEDRVYVKVNKKFLTTFGYDEEEVIGKNSVELGILDHEESKKVGQLLRERGKLESDVVRCITKDGREIYTVSSIETIEINGKRYRMSSFLDISKVKEQQRIIEKQYAEIIESINYASIIQHTVLPNPHNITKILPNSFVLYKPRNIISGDFYWIKKVGKKVFLAVCDCTGHGVPGAILSFIGIKLLNKFISEYQFHNPSEILNQFNKEYHHMNDGLAGCTIKDGMDIALCVVDLEHNVMEYAGAYNPVYLIRQGELRKLPVDKIPIHLFNGDSDKLFNNHHISLEKDDLIYLFSDGYADQFGGPFNKKFNYKNFRELLLCIHHLPMQEQKEILNKTIEDWKHQAGEEQTDDILIFGFNVL